MISFLEAESQLLIVLVELAQPIETPNNNHYRFYPKTVDEAAEYFKGYRVDWAAAGISLQAQGLVEPAGDFWRLTPAGEQAACRVRAERPPIYYWYRQFFDTAPLSPAYGEFCSRLYGLDLTQAGFSDMDQLALLLKVLALRPGEHVLELGCGSGRVAEWVASGSGATVLGVDYTPGAIVVARARTAAKRGRLDFKIANMDALDLPRAGFDAIYSIDSLYMPAHLDDMLRQLAGLLRPGGRMAAYYSHMLWEAAGELTAAQLAALQPEHTPLGEALARLGLPFETWDVSRQTYEMMQRKHTLGETMRPVFAAEGSLPLWQFIMAESEASTAPYDAVYCTQARYLYLIKGK